MNKLFIVGNVCKDPETRATSNGKAVCSFTVAVNSHIQGRDATFFRVTAWEKRAEICQKYLVKGSKVAITGSVSVSTYEGKDGATRASLDVTADAVEFLSGKAHSGDAEDGGYKAMQKVDGGFTQVDEDELPF